jgi:hypothetical protein
MDEDFGRNAAACQAGAAKLGVFNDGAGATALQTIFENRQTDAAANNHDIIVFHGNPPRSGMLLPSLCPFLRHLQPEARDREHENRPGINTGPVIMDCLQINRLDLYAGEDYQA